jgi:hypothetical protein
VALPRHQISDRELSSAVEERHIWAFPMSEQGCPTPFPSHPMPSPSCLPGSDFPILSRFPFSTTRHHPHQKITETWQITPRGQESVFAVSDSQICETVCVRQHLICLSLVPTSARCGRKSLIHPLGQQQQEPTFCRIVPSHLDASFLAPAALSAHFPQT